MKYLFNLIFAADFALSLVQVDRSTCPRPQIRPRMGATVLHNTNIFSVLLI
jgi:hypothetical protein